MVDKKQFLELLKPHSRSLSAYCLSISNNRDDAKDLMSETILTALEKIQELKDPLKFKSFLFSIARKKNSNMFRKIKEVLMDSISENSMIIENRISDYDVSYLYEQLNKLPFKYKETLILFEISGFSIKEISEIQKTSETNVKSRLKRGREKLKELYKDEIVLNDVTTIKSTRGVNELQ